MIFGQSGGGRKVETLLAMPSAKGLFHRAVIESGVAIKVASREIAIQNAEHLLSKLEIRPSEVHSSKNSRYNGSLRPISRLCAIWARLINRSRDSPQR